MLLKNLISDLKPDISSIKIRRISFDSRSIKKGDLFVSIKGQKFDGNDYIHQATSKGARALVHSQPIKKNKKKIYIKVKDTRDTLARISAKYYKNKPKNGPECSVVCRTEFLAIPFEPFVVPFGTSKIKCNFYFNILQ